MTFTEALLLLITGAIINGVIIFLLQSSYKKGISEELKELENRLATELMVKTTQFSKSYDVRIDFVQVLYKKIHFVKKQICLLAIPWPNFKGEPGKESLYPAIAEIVDDFKITYKDKKTFLPHELIRIIDEFVSEIDHVRVSLYHYSYAIEHKEQYSETPEKIEWAVNELEKATSQLDMKLSALLDNFEASFRSLIGADIVEKE